MSPRGTLVPSPESRARWPAAPPARPRCAAGQLDRWTWIEVIPVPDDAPPWLDPEPDEVARPRRRSLVALLAVAPWLVVIVLLVLPRASGAPAGVGGADGPHHAHPDPDEGAVDAGDAITSPRDGTTDDDEDHDRAAPDDDLREGGAADGWDAGGTGWSITEERGNWRVAPGDGATTALAVAVARAWLTGVAPTLELAGIPPSRDATYVEHLVVEALERPAVGAAVVTLLAIVLERDDEDQHHVRVERLAVPVVETGPQPRPGGPPWWLAPPELEPAPLSGTPIADPEVHLAALDALRRGGLDDIELLALETSDGWPVLASVRVDGPHHDGWEGTVWLRRHLDGFALAGVPLGPADRKRPAAGPAEEDAP
jgi:hypothetical protein